MFDRVLVLNRSRDRGVAVNITTLAPLGLIEHEPIARILTKTIEPITYGVSPKVH